MWPMVSSFGHSPVFTKRYESFRRESTASLVMLELILVLTVSRIFPNASSSRLYVVPAAHIEIQMPTKI